MVPRVALGESKLRARRRRRRVFIVGACVLLFLALCGGVVYLTWAPFFRLTTVVVEGVTPAQVAEVEHVVRGQIAGGYMGVFAKNNMLLYPKDEVVQALTKDFPTLKDIVVRTSDRHTLLVSAVERQPSAVWCGAAPSTVENCLFLDETGLAYAASLDYTGVGYRKYFGRLSTSTQPEEYLSPQSFHALDVFVDTLEKKVSSTSLQYVFVDENNDVHVVYKNGFELRFELSADTANVLEKLQLVFMTAIFKQHALSDFEYLDLRFGEKLYYKLRQ